MHRNTSADDNLSQLDTHHCQHGTVPSKDYVYNQYVLFRRNEEYWKKEAKIKNIIVDLSAERSDRFNKISLIMNVKLAFLVLDSEMQPT